MTNNKLLLDEYPLLILPRFAVLIGLNEAIILQQIHYWLLKSGKEIENEKWVYNTFEEWHKQFPFFSIPTIKRIFKKLKTKDLIKIKNHAENKHDRTNWYTVNYSEIEQLEKSSNASYQSDTIDSSKLTPCSLYTETTSETTNDFPKNGKSDFNNLNDFSIKEEKKEKKESAKKEPKLIYSEFVSMTTEDYLKLIDKYGVQFTGKAIEILNNYKGSNGKNYKNDYLAILNWVVNKIKRENATTQKHPAGRYHAGEQDYSKKF